MTCECPLRDGGTSREEDDSNLGGQYTLTLMLLCELQVIDLFPLFDQQKAPRETRLDRQMDFDLRTKRILRDLPGLVALQERGTSRWQRFILLHWPVSLP